MQSLETQATSDIPPPSGGMCIEILDLGHMPVDVPTFTEAILKDGLADWRRFERTQELRSFRRAVTDAERQAYGLRSDIVAIVSRDGDDITTEYYDISEHDTAPG